MSTPETPDGVASISSACAVTPAARGSASAWLDDVWSARAIRLADVPGRVSLAVGVVVGQAAIGPCRRLRGPVRAAAATGA